VELQYAVLCELQDGQSVSLEPGGQFELSGAPLETLHQTCAEVNSHLYQVHHHHLVFNTIYYAYNGGFSKIRLFHEFADIITNRIFAMIHEEDSPWSQ